MGPVTSALAAKLDPSDAVRRIGRYLVDAAMASAGWEEVGPFALILDAHDANSFRNYAVPQENTAPTAADLRALVDAFHARGRLPRLEFLPRLSPALADALETAGFAVEQRLPIMIRPPACGDGLTQHPTSRIVVTDDDLRQAASVQNAAYGAGPATAHDLARLRKLTDGGGGVALASVDGEPVGSGLFAIPRKGVTEIAAVGVLADARRSGVGTDLVRRLLIEVERRGADLPFLMAQQESEARLYRRIGFVEIATMIHVSMKVDRD